MISRVSSHTGTAGPVNLLPGGSGNFCHAQAGQAAGGGGEIFQLTGCGEGAEGLRQALAGCGHGAVSFRSFPRVFPDFSKPAKSLNHRKNFQNNCIDTDAQPLSFSPSGLDGSALAGCAEIEA